MKLEIKECSADSMIIRRIVDNAFMGNHGEGLITVYKDNSSDAEVKEIINMRSLTFVGINVLDHWG